MHTPNTPRSAPEESTAARPEAARMDDVRSVLAMTQDVFGDEPHGEDMDAPSIGSPAAAGPVPARRASYAALAGVRDAAPSAPPNRPRRLLVLAISLPVAIASVSAALYFGLPSDYLGGQRGPTSLILQGDSLAAAGDFDAARERYATALRQRPQAREIRQRLDRLDGLRAASLRLTDNKDEHFRRLVARGDSLLNLLAIVGPSEPILAEQITAAARETFLRALTHRPEDQSVRRKLVALAQATTAPQSDATADEAGPDLEAERETLRRRQRDQYRLAVEDGDRLLAEGRYLEAQIRFKEALLYGQDDPYAANRLEIIDQLWKEAGRAERYQGYMQRGDELLAERLLDQARVAYREALAARPGDQAALARIAEADRIEFEAQRTATEQQERTRRHGQAVSQADALLASGQYQAAFDHLQVALKSFPHDRALTSRSEKTLAILHERARVDENGIYKVLTESERPKQITPTAELYDRIKYPPAAIQTRTQGRVYVQLVVDENGRVQDPRILRGLSPECDQEVLRVVRTARFEPARVDGRPVKAYHTIFVQFKLPSGT